MPLPAEIPSAYPISDLRTKLNDIETEAHESKRPIVLTRNGASSLVVMSSEAYNDQLRHERAVRKLREAEIEAKYVKDTVSLADSRKRIQLIGETLEKAYA